MNEDSVFEIDILHAFSVLLSKLWLIIISALVFACGFFIYASVGVTPLYQSSAMFYVNNNNLSIGSLSYSISSSDISASQSLVDTYIVILKTRNTLETVIEKADLSYEYEELVNMISASAVNATEVFKVNVTSEDPTEACVIANTIAEVLPDKISEIVTGSGAKVVDYAVVNPHRVSTSTFMLTLVGALLGVIACSAFLIIRDMYDVTIREEDDVTSSFNDIPVLAVIPSSDRRHNSSYYYYNNKYRYGGYRYGYGYYGTKPKDKNQNKLFSTRDERKK